MHPTNPKFTGITTEESIQSGYKVITTSTYSNGRLVKQKCTQDDTVTVRPSATTATSSGKKVKASVSSQPSEETKLEQLLAKLRMEHLPPSEFPEFYSTKTSSIKESDEESSSSSDESSPVTLRNATISGVSARSYMGQNEDGEWGTFTVRTYGNGEERTSFKPQSGNKLSVTASVITAKPENYTVTSNEDDVGAGYRHTW